MKKLGIEKLAALIILSGASLSLSLPANAFKDPHEIPTTIILSIDGFASHYLDESKQTAKAAKSLVEMKRKGASSKGLTPVYPSKTFPNHLSMVTGVYPHAHGLVHNKFYSRSLAKTYRLGAGKAQPKWLTATPIWALAEQQNITTGIYFWPESEINFGEHSPTYSFAYKHDTPNEARVAQIEQWLAMTGDKKPKLILSYFSTVDSAGHDFGTNSKELVTAIEEVDLLITQLRQTIKEQYQGNVNLVIVSDHGMVDIDINDIIELPSAVQRDRSINVVNGQTQLYIYGDNQNAVQESYIALLSEQKSKKDQRYKVYKQSDFPTHWRLSAKSPVIPDIIVNAEPPFVFKSKHGHYGAATHGYDPRSTQKLDGIFLAEGPSFKSGEISRVENVHIFALLANLIGLDLSNKSLQYDRRAKNPIVSDVLPFKTLLNN